MDGWSAIFEFANKKTTRFAVVGDMDASSRMKHLMNYSTRLESIQNTNCKHLSLKVITNNLYQLLVLLVATQYLH